MSWWEVLLLALVEGVTEFLPISSTGHLILLSTWLGRAHEAFVQDYEIIIQGGAILAVVVYSHRRLWQPRMYGLVAAAFLPTATIGFFAKDFLETLLSSPLVVAINLILGGLVLLSMDRWFKSASGGIEALPVWRAGVIGLVQSLSLFPGVSRAAAALFGARWMGLRKEDAAEFSFLLAVPTLGAASAYKLYKSSATFEGAHLLALGVGIGVSFLVALLSMRFLVGLWQRYGMQPFGVYRIVLGAIVLLWLSFFS
ncbi:MAG: undecaprenyl-diphosphate phosphatase [Bacteroidia bacterium]|nr:undecaprenyl-diphosphate phosphatase [Bacteroidia bacterium]MCX7652874.1 undecaprenyl-diphosphate phosphatase [Bacteroidia bacterium]MDW8416658.1 undecaprenyl-diphosphate phosphatase [Bacteroidia bacterium]